MPSPGSTINDVRRPIRVIASRSAYVSSMSVWVRRSADVAKRALIRSEAVRTYSTASSGVNVALSLNSGSLCSGVIVEPFHAPCRSGRDAVCRGAGTVTSASARNGRIENAQISRRSTATVRAKYTTVYWDARAQNCMSSTKRPVVRCRCSPRKAYIASGHFRRLRRRRSSPRQRRAVRQR